MLTKKGHLKIAKESKVLCDWYTAKAKNFRLLAKEYQNVSSDCIEQAEQNEAFAQEHALVSKQSLDLAQTN